MKHQHVVSLLLRECGSLDQRKATLALLRYDRNATFRDTAEATRSYRDRCSGKKCNHKSAEKPEKINANGKEELI